MTSPNFKIFIDFDGTAATIDVGEELFLKFGDPVKANEIITEWIEGEINSTQCWEKLCGTIENLDLNKFDEFIGSVNIDRHLKAFIESCESRRIEVFILSDGLDYYIKRILEKENLGHLPVYSNKLVIENNKLIPAFPYTDEECGKCANCKRNHVINHSSDDDITIYIGDGFSDTCAAQYCDFIFAKKSLLKFCEVNRISYFPFNDFGDVIARTNELFAKKRIKKRHQAELKRREVYLNG